MPPGEAMLEGKGEPSENIMHYCEEMTEVVRRIIDDEKYTVYSREITLKFGNRH